MTFARSTASPASGWNPHPRLWLSVAVAILLLAAAARLGLLAEAPPGLAQDEVLDADIASFIRQGGHALFFRHGYGHEPLYHYWAAPFQALLGDNVLSIRLPAAFLGLLLIALTLRWARRDFGATAAVVAGLGLAVSWWPIIFSRIGIRPILEPVLLVAAMWFWPLRSRELRRREVASAAVAGLFLGLSIYSYTAARGAPLIPLALLAVVAVRYVRVRRSGGRTDEISAIRAQAVYAAVVAAVALVIYAPLALTLRANPDLQQRIDQLEGPLTALAAGDAGPVVNATIATLGVFSFTGDPRWTYSLPGRPLFDLATAALFYAGLALALWRWRQPRYAVLVIWLVVALLPSALSPDAPSTVRLIGALPVVYLMPGLAVDEAMRWLSVRSGRAAPKRTGFMPLFLGVLMFIFAINVYRTARDGFVRWPGELETRLRYQTALRDIGEHWRNETWGRPLVVAEVFYEPIDADSLRRSIGGDVAARWIQTGAGVAGALVWPSAEGSAAGALYVPEYAPLDPDLMALAGIARQPDFRSDGSPSFALYILPESPAVDFVRRTDDFTGESNGELMTLTALSTPTAANGEIQFASWWGVAGALPDDLAIFVHLTDEAGQIVAQFDGLDAAAATLRRGDSVLQRHVIPLPAEMRPGIYTLDLGLYRRGDGRRMLLPDGSDRVELGHCLQAEAGPPAVACSLTESD
jgi:4-amino-4-deoxy-L-arabinose transferase-like glycosyltransferase